MEEKSRQVSTVGGEGLTRERGKLVVSCKGPVFIGKNQTLNSWGLCEKMFKRSRYQTVNQSAWVDKLDLQEPI